MSNAFARPKWANLINGARANKSTALPMMRGLSEICFSYNAEPHPALHLANRWLAIVQARHARNNCRAHPECCVLLRPVGTRQSVYARLALVVDPIEHRARVRRRYNRASQRALASGTPLTFSLSALLPHPETLAIHSLSISEVFWQTGGAPNRVSFTSFLFSAGLNAVRSVANSRGPTLSLPRWRSAWTTSAWRAWQVAFTAAGWAVR